MKRLPIALCLIFLWCPTVNAEEYQAPLASRQEAERVQIDKEMASWHGFDVNKLLAQIGPPTSTYSMPNGDVIYIYDYSRAIPQFGITNVCVKNYVVAKTTSLIYAHSFRGCVSLI